MQTFLPYPDFAECARVLDTKRIGKQIIECFQIIKALREPTYGWGNHPAVKMWAGKIPYLRNYQIDMHGEWLRRRGKDHAAFVHTTEYISELYFPTGMTLPDWLGHPKLHASHRANLLRKDPEWYGQFGWTESPDMPYFWPTKELA